MCFVFVRGGGGRWWAEIVTKYALLECGEDICCVGDGKRDGISEVLQSL
jgi:hypothetical protein